MSEPNVDLRGLLHGLHDHDVEYVLLGAIAMVFYGCVRTVEDEPDTLLAAVDQLAAQIAATRHGPRPIGASA